MRTKRGSGRPAAANGDGGPSKAARAIEGLKELCRTIEAGIPVEERFTVRRARFDFDPREYGSADVRRVRGLMGMSQAVFAYFLGVDANTVRAWEQGRNTPAPIARRFLAEIEAAPEHWKQRIRASLLSEQVVPAKK